MKNDPDDKLEKLIHRELAKLPDLQAPETLIPRVMEAIRTQAQMPWWRRSWFNWPIGPRMLSMSFAVGLFSLVFTGVAFFWQDVIAFVSIGTFRDWLGQFSVVESFFSTLANAVVVILSTIGNFWLTLSLTIAFLAYLSCVGIGTVCFRLAINKRRADEN